MKDFLKNKQNLLIIALLIIIVLLVITIVSANEIKKEEDGKELPKVGPNEAVIIHESQGELIYSVVNETPEYEYTQIYNCENECLVTSSNGVYLAINDGSKYLLLNKENGDLIDMPYSSNEYQLKELNGNYYYETDEKIIVYDIETKKEYILEEEYTTSLEKVDGRLLVAYQDYFTNYSKIVDVNTEEIIFENNNSSKFFEIKIVNDTYYYILVNASNTGGDINEYTIYDKEKELIVENAYDYTFEEKGYLLVTFNNYFENYNLNTNTKYTSDVYKEVTKELYNKPYVLANKDNTLYILDYKGNIINEDSSTVIEYTNYYMDQLNPIEDYMKEYKLNEYNDDVLPGLSFTVTLSGNSYANVYYYDFDTKEALILNP